MARNFLGALAALALVGATASAADELRPGKILVADKKLRDPNFAQTVILLITYDEDGSVGLVLNHQSDVAISLLLPGVKGASGRKDPAFSGGPVDQKAVLALLRSSTKPDGAQHVSGDIYAVLNQDALEAALASGAGPNRFRLYVGYAGWGPGQLDAETEAGAWHVFNNDAATVFDSSPDSLWDRLMRRADQVIVRAFRPEPRSMFLPLLGQTR